MEAQKNNLDTFKILYIIKGVLNFLISIIFVFYFFMGPLMKSTAQYDPSMNDAPIDLFSVIQTIGAVGFIICIIAGILTLMAGGYLGKRKHHTFIIVIAVLNCLSGILGILLGIFTIIELQKPHVKELFVKNKI